MDSDHSPEFRMFSRLVDGQPPRVREYFHYALAMLLVENRKAEVIEKRVIDSREHVTFGTVSGELFSVVKPDAGEKVLEVLVNMVREVLKEDLLGGDSQ